MEVSLGNVFNFGNPTTMLCYCMKYINNLQAIFPLFPPLRRKECPNDFFFFCQHVKMPIRHIFLSSVHESSMQREDMEEKSSQLLFVLLGWVVSHQESAEVLFHRTAVFSWCQWNDAGGASWLPFGTDVIHHKEQAMWHPLVSDCACT